VLGEFGLDSVREGERNKSEALKWQIESAFRAGLAGAVVFSFTDDWFKGGHPVTGWFMGLTTRERAPKESFYAVREAFAVAPHFPMTHHPKVSVVVACYNGARTLKACLDSLGRLNYPDYEVILVDDGSTDATPDIAAPYTNVRYIRQTNHGLSVARNTGIEAAEGEIIAFTDADCRADEDWLYYLVGDLLNSRFAGIGGHNFLPPEDSAVAAAVLVSPGGPAHVMLTDRIAEHIPGCNMVFYKWALKEIGGFDPIFTKAGDDVDICWRLQQRGYRIGFNPAGFVWHYRRSTVKAYLKQQSGYGEAEALLVRKHPEYFNSFGGSLWRGQIYTAAKFGLVLGRSVIYHGIFATGFFQTIYAAAPAWTLMLCTSIGIMSSSRCRCWCCLPLSFPPSGGTGEPARLDGRLHCRGGQAELPRTEAFLVQAVDRAIVLPAADRARTGSIPGAAGRSSHSCLRPGTAGDPQAQGHRRGPGKCLLLVRRRNQPHRLAQRYHTAPRPTGLADQD
jgi:glycosyltransferase involved in cell wall biosynthesis